MAAIGTSKEQEALLVRLEQLAKKIDALMVAKGEVVDAMDYHVWTRPQLDVEAFEEDNGLAYYLLMHLADEPTKNYGISNQPSLGLTFGGFGNHVEIRFADNALDTLRVVSDNPACFACVEEALKRTVHALENDSSLQEGLSNAQVLSDQLPQLFAWQLDAWQRMVNVWGTDSMKNAVEVANALADPNSNLQAWKTLVASSWGPSSQPTLVALDTASVFAQTQDTR